MQNPRPFLRAAASACLLYTITSLSEARAEFAATVVDYHPGGGTTLTNPYASVGQPGDIVGAGSGFDSIASTFSPHYEADHLAQIGEGGQLVLRLERTVAATVGAPEIALYTNVGLIDGDFPNGFAAGVFGIDQVSVDVSADGSSWSPLGLVTCDFPSSAFTDAPSPFQSTTDGLTPSDYGKPHSLQLADLDAHTHSEILNALGGSAGGTWIELEPSGLTEASYIRLRVEDDGDPETNLTFELAGVSINSIAAGSPTEPFAFTEDFATDPLGSRAISDAGHASYSADTLSVNFDLSTNAARTVWPLGIEFTDATSFRYSVDFTIRAIDFNSSNFGQISLGLINSSTTGNTRTTSPSNSWDLVTVDYFPNPDFSTFTPTVIGSQGEGQTDAFANLSFPSGSASLINEPGEIGQLPTNTMLTASVGYDAATRILTLRLDGQPINAFGPNPDGDETTIQHTIPAGITFTVDSFALLCWSEPSGGTAAIDFTRLAVSTSGPAANYYSWADANISELLERAPSASALENGQSNLLNYALGNTLPFYAIGGRNFDLTWQRPASRDDVTVTAQVSTDLANWTDLSATSIGGGPDIDLLRARTTSNGSRKVVRLKASRP